MKKLFTMFMSVVLLATMVVGGTLAQELLTIDFNNLEKQAVLIEQNVTVSEFMPPYTDYTVAVTNKSNDTVYVRTLLAFEVLNNVTTPYLLFDNEAIQPVIEVAGEEEKQVRIAVDGREYDVYECYYPLEQHETAVCLQGFAFADGITNENFANEQYCVMALSQAIAAETDTERAEIAVSENMKQLFGAVTSSNHPWMNQGESWTGTPVSTQSNLDVE